jgi:hypothetical protein
METFKPTAKSPEELAKEELAKKGTKQRRAEFKKSEAERDEGVSRLHRDEAKTSTEIKRFEDKLKRIKNEKERKAIYARLAKLVEDKKKLNKQIKSEKKDLGLSEEDAKTPEDLELRMKEIYQEGDENVTVEGLKEGSKGRVVDAGEYHAGKVGSGQFEYRKTPEKGTSAGTNEESRKIIEEMKALKKRAKELEAEGDYEGGEDADDKKDGDKKEEPHKSQMSEAYKEFKKSKEDEAIEKAMGKVSGKEAKTEEQERESLLKALEDAKNAYAMQDYKTNSTMQRIRKGLGMKSLATNPESLKDLEERRKDYEKTLADWKDFRVKEFKAKYEKMTPEEMAKQKPEMDKEMGLLVKEFNLDQYLDLCKARTDASHKSREGTIWGKQIEVFNMALDKYRKLGFKKQMLITAGLFAGGSVALLTGSAFLAGAVGVAGITRRLLGSSSLALATAGWQESGRRAIERRQSRKDVEKTTKEMNQIGDLEKRNNAFNGRLDYLLANSGPKYVREGEKSYSRKKWAVLVGGLAFLAPTVASYLMAGEIPPGGGGKGGVPGGKGGGTFEDALGEKWGTKPPSPSGGGGAMGGHFPFGEPKGGGAGPGTYEDALGEKWGAKPGGSGGSDMTQFEKDARAGAGARPGYEKGRMGGWDPEPIVKPNGPGISSEFGEGVAPSHGADVSPSGGSTGHEPFPGYETEADQGVRPKSYFEKLKEYYNQKPKPDLSQKAPDLQNQPWMTEPIGTPEGGGMNPDIPSNQSAAGAGKVPENPWNKIPGVETAGRGDSVWSMLDRQLQARYGEGFKNMDPAKKTFMIDYFKDRVAENPKEFGLKNIDTVMKDQKIDFSRLFGNKADVDALFSDVNNLDPEKIASITKNNKLILDWVNHNPGSRLTSERVEEILQGRSGGRGTGAGRFFEQGGTNPAAPIAEGFDFSQVDNELEGIQDIASRSNEILARNPNINQLNIVDAQSKLARLNDQLSYDRQSLNLGVENTPGVRGSGTSIRESMINRMASRDALAQQVQDYNDLQELKQLYTEKYRNVFKGVTQMIIQEEGSGKTYDEISSMPASQYIGEHSGGKFGGFYKDCEKIMGSAAARPRADEDIVSWAHRVSGRMLNARSGKIIN